MKQFKSFGLVVVTLLFSVTMAFAAKQNIHILSLIHISYLRIFRTFVRQRVSETLRKRKR